MSADVALWIRRYHPSPQSRIRLVCFPHAGGSAPFFLPLSAALAPDVEVCVVQYPGRQDRRAEPAVPSIPTLADRVTDVLERLVDRPVALFGHSMGAVVGYEVALRLADRGLRPDLLLASGRRAPSRYRAEGARHSDDASLIAELQLLSGTAGGVLTDPEMLEMVMPAIRNDFLAIERYRHEPTRRLDCPVMALIGDVDPRVTPDEACAWAEHTAGAFQLRVFPGGHFYLTERAPEVIGAVSEALSACVGR